jgi:prolyl 4-hydroxylase
MDESPEVTVVKPKASVLVRTQINGEDVQGEEQAREALEREAYIIDFKTIIPEDEEPPELNPITGVAKVLKSYLVSKDPKIWLVPNFVSDFEADHLLELAEGKWVPSTVGAGVYKTNDESKDLSNKQSENRTSMSCMLKSAQDSTVEAIELRLAAIAGMQVDYLERLNMVRYAPGTFFNKHHDGRFRPLTVFLYLNDLPEGDGGETFFPELKLKFKPSKGGAVMWENTKDGVEDMRMVHYGLLPRTATKVAVNCFFNDKPVKQLEAAAAAAQGDAADDENFRKTAATIDPDSLRGATDETQTPLSRDQLRSFTVFTDPKISVVPNFLSSDETSALMAILTKEPVEDASVYGRIEQRCAALAGLPHENMEPMTVAKSEPGMCPDGMFYSGAQDGSYTKKFGNKTLQIFLNDVPEGGELRFPRLRLQVRPRAGTCVVWSITGPDGSEDLRAAHQGRPPKAGARYTTSCVFRNSAIKKESSS